MRFRVLLRSGAVYVALSWKVQREFENQRPVLRKHPFEIGNPFQGAVKWKFRVLP